jgi:PAS domain S-box-containing protein
MSAQPCLALSSEAESEKAVQFHSLLADQAPGGLVLTNLSGAIQWVNEAGATMFGYGKDEMIGMLIDQLVPSDQRSSHQQYREDYKTGRQRRAMVHDIKREVQAERKDGSCFPIEIELNSFMFEGERLTVSAIVDLTEHKRYEDELMRSNKDLEQFAHLVAHDIRAPIRQLRMYAEILEKDCQEQPGRQGQETIERIKRIANRANTMIDDMLAFASLKNKEQAQGPVALRSVLDQALTNLAMVIHETGAEITIGELPAVQGIDSHLSRLFQNLVGNALKFRSPDRVPTIAIEARPGANGMAEIRIKDNGIGVAKRDQARIFGMLERGHGNSAYEGAGIGLASCKRIVDLHGGEIGIESEENEGSTFWFTLTLADACRQVERC